MLLLMPKSLKCQCVNIISWLIFCIIMLLWGLYVVQINSLILLLIRNSYVFVEMYCLPWLVKTDLNFVFKNTR